MRRAALFDALEYDPSDPKGYRSAASHLTRLLGGRELAVKGFEVPPGESLCPYHYEYVEEWLIVLEGSVVVRTPDCEEEEAGAGSAVCFPAGPDGAHKLTNRGTAPARLVMFSSAHEPSVAVYPDSDKIGVWPGRKEDVVMLRRTDGHVDYYDGE
ncbi:MAG: cupin domain-containing protein [Solirubrobacteraceae bacterium]